MATTDIAFGQQTITYPSTGLLGQPARYNQDGSGIADPSGGADNLFLTRKVVTLSLGADSAALATNTAVPFTAIERDDTGLCNIATAPTKIYLPDAVRFFRVSFAVAYKYATRAAGITLSSAAVGASVTATADASVFLSTDVGRYLYSGTGRSLITGYTSGTVVTVTNEMAYAGTSLTSGAWTIVTGTYRGASMALTLNTSTSTTVKGLVNPVRSAPLMNGTSTEAVIQYTSRTVDTADLANWGTGATADDNFIEMKTSHDASADAVLFGSATGGTFFQVEMWE